MRLLSKLVLCCPVLLCAQTPNAGLQPDWDIRVILQEMSDHAARLTPVLNEVDAGAWVEKGASETYTAQLQSSKDQARAMGDDAKALERNPEKISACLQLYFRIQGLEQMVGSLVEGIRKYQGPELAEKLASLSAENGANRNRFESYIVNLAAQQEQVCAVMDHEAQRCRSILATQPPSKANRGKKN
ncbi:MAG TPA: hypothetical protein VLX58_15710 [Bryobacteraceae bacterium]|nr:hypothetical protein [Bryobacteraceae bacterium]